MASALILAAGRGERLRPLTDAKPKPLLEAGGRTLIEWQVERLVRGGFTDLVVNHAHRGEMIEAALGDGARFGARIRYSPESPALETAGGVVKALPLLAPGAFLVVSSDIYTEFEYARLHAKVARITSDPVPCTAHFVLVDNPPWHCAGDMGLAGDVVVRDGPRLTYGNIAVFHPRMFDGIEAGTWLKLFPWAYRFVDEGRVTGERYTGEWDNIGTPGQLDALDRRLGK